MDSIGTHRLELRGILGYILPLILLPFDFLQLLCNFVNLNFNLFFPQIFAYFQNSDQIGRIPLNGFDAHVVVHSFLQKS
jgi:hypothetical protein